MHRLLKRTTSLALVFFLVLTGCADMPETNEGPVEADSNTSGTQTESVNATSPVSTRDPVKRALLVGIDQYASPTVSNLRGAINDVQKMQALLVSKFEFPEENILVLTDELATHDSIIRAIQDHLIAPTQPGDIVVMHYAGHGSQMPDREDDDETDGLDETIVPHDSRQAGKFDISDDQIRGLLDQLAQKTDNITFIFDSCHSGTGSRASGKPRRVKPDERTPPPAPSYARSTRGTEGGLWRQGDNFVLLSGSRSDQYSFEYFEGGKGYGAFTYFLTEELERAGAGVTYRDIMDKVRSSVEAYYGRQTPQIEGTGEDSYVFSDSADIAEPYVLVSPSSGSAVTLQAGAVHGVTEGSKYAVYAPGTKRFEEPATLTAHVEITNVANFTSTAQITDNGTVEANARAVEREHAYPDQQVLVYFKDIAASPTLQAVREKLEALNHIDEHPEENGYTLLLREKGERIIIEAPDTTYLNVISVSSSVNPSTADTVVARVEDWARWYNILGIKNPSPNAKIEVELSATEVVAPAGFDCVVTNKSSRRLFITILDISTDGSVTQVFPHPSQAGAEALLAGQSKTITFPETFVPDDLPQGRKAVNDYLKVFATTDEVDLRPLTQEPIVSRGNPEAMTDPLGGLLNQAASGATRGTGTGVQLSNWVTEQAMITVKER